MWYNVSTVRKTVTCSLLPLSSYRRNVRCAQNTSLQRDKAYADRISQLGNTFPCSGSDVQLFVLLKPVCHMACGQLHYYLCSRCKEHSNEWCQLELKVRPRFKLEVFSSSVPQLLHMWTDGTGSYFTWLL